MKARIGSVAILVAISILFTGGLALATDFAWQCSGLCTLHWSTPSSWDQGSGFPDDANDNASITSSGNLIIYDPGSALTINNLTLAGASPTKRKLHIDDAALTVANLDLDDYAELDVDQDLTVTGTTTLAGNIFIDVAASTTFDMEDVDVDGATTGVKGTTTGTLKADEVVIDADADGASRTFTWGTGTLDIENKLSLNSAQTANTYIAKLWVRTGTVDIDDGGPGTATLVIDGGDDSSRQAELDIDGTLTAEETDFEPGYATIDVASAATATGGDVVFKSGAIVKKTGSGTFRSGS